MPRLVIWNAEVAEKELKKRLDSCRNVRKNIEYQWEESERSLFNVRGETHYPSDISISFESEAEIGIEDIDSSSNTIGVNYIFKNHRLIHSQLSANPPTVVPRPTSNDPTDRRKADAADRLIRYAIRKYKMQEVFDACSNNTLIYGVGFIKTIWNSEKGDIYDFNEEANEVIMEGDIDISVPSTWNVYMDPDAEKWDDVRYIFEKMLIPWEEAMYRFPDKQEVLEKYRMQGERNKQVEGYAGALREMKSDVVEIYQYWEKGLPYNGMQGRFCYCTYDGELLSEVETNPFKFSAPANRGLDDEVERMKPQKAELPYHQFTDIDVPNTPWGKSVISFEATLQDMMNRIDNVTLDAMQANGVPKMILPESAEIADDSITNSPWNVIKITGSQPPHMMEVAQVSPDMHTMRDRIKLGLDDMAGVNETMFGQQSREMSGLSMQYATNQGNMIRRRLFNKYVLLVESVYKSYLNLIRENWDDTKTIYVLGKEKAFESIDIQGADIDGGFDLVVEYGASLSLDPTARREEIITLMPIFEKAGVPTRVIMNMLKLNELEGVYDKLQMANDRQRELFEEMIATGEQISPAELEDHKNMLQYCYDYIMTSEFKYLDEESKQLIEEHVKLREQMAAQAPGAAGAPGPLPPIPGMAPAPGGAAPAPEEGAELPPIPPPA